jgi:hypothetical protein
MNENRLVATSAGRGKADENTSATNNSHCRSVRLRVDGNSAANPDLASSKNRGMTIQQPQRMPWLNSDFEEKFFEAFGREMRLGEREFFGMGIAQPVGLLVTDCPNGVWRPHPLRNLVRESTEPSTRGKETNEP